MEEQKMYQKAVAIVKHLLLIFRGEKTEKSEAFSHWVQENRQAAELLTKLEDADALITLLEEFDRPEKEEESCKLVARIQRYRMKRRVLRFSGVAAVLLLATFILWRREENRAYELLPSRQPVLILSDGKNINLGTLERGAALDIDDARVIHADSGQIDYSLQRVDKQGMTEVSYNILQIPQQCNYSVILSDGTVVRLNALSRLKYPAQFTGGERKVELTGEAYFEVKKDTIPFVVTANKVRIRVYGTKFNVDAYGENQVATVLEEGCVGVALMEDGAVVDEKILRPHQRSVVNLLTGEQQTTEVDIRKYMSWTQGFLRYDNDCMEELIRDLTQWYGVEFEFTDQSLKKIKVSASINKDMSLENVLVMISNTTKIKFLKSERRYQICRK